MSPPFSNPATKISRFPLPSGDSQPTTKLNPAAAAAVTFTKKQLFIPSKPAALPFNLYTARLHLYSAAPNRYRSQKIPILQNRRNPSFPFHGIMNAFKGFSHKLSTFFVGYSHARCGRDEEREHHRNFWSELLCPNAMAQDNHHSQSWDSHNLQANMILQLNKLNAFKRYKISAVKFLHPRSREAVGAAADTFGDIPDLPRPGGVYTKQDLVDRLHSLESSGFFEKIDFDARTNPDGSIEINVPFREKLYPSKTKFSCIAVDGLPELRPVEMDENVTWKEQAAGMRKMSEQYRRRMEKAAGCILPGAVQQEIEAMMVKRPSLSGGLLKKITDKVMNWYRDNGYDAARLVSMSNPELNPAGEITFEMVEGKIDKLGVKFMDKLGNGIEGGTDIRIVKRALPEEVLLDILFYFFNLVFISKFINLLRICLILIN